MEPDSDSASDSSDDSDEEKLIPKKPRPERNPGVKVKGVSTWQVDSRIVSRLVVLLLVGGLIWWAVKPDPPPPPPPPPARCVDDDASMRSATPGLGSDGQGFTCAEILAAGPCDQVADLGFCGCSCPATAAVEQLPPDTHGQLLQVEPQAQPEPEPRGAWVVGKCIEPCTPKCACGVIPSELPSPTYGDATG